MSAIVLLICAWTFVTASTRSACALTIACGSSLENAPLALSISRAVGGDLGDELVVQRLDLVGRLHRAEVGDDLVDGLLEAVERLAVLRGRARRGDLARELIELRREVVLGLVDRVDVVVGGLGVRAAAGGHEREGDDE